MINTRKLILPSVIGCLAAGLTAVPTYAQDTQVGAMEEVVVTGIRRSLINSMAIKENSSSIVEAISPEDIGKLPDTSIAESLARLPGLAGERRNGRTSGVSVRGFNEDYVATTMNGRELLGIGDNRGVEYDLYPSEIISNAVVYKTPDASLVNQGLGGIVDLRTLRPLESDRIISFNGNYEVNGMNSENPDYDDTGHRLALTYSDTFNNDTMGFAVTLATMESPSQEEYVRMWGYAEEVQDDYPEADYIMGGHDSYVRSGLMSRDTVSSVFQWEPNERLTMTADLIYIDFSEEKVFRGLEEGGPYWGGISLDDFSVGAVENGLVTEGEFTGFHSVIRNDAEDKEGELTTFGLNVDYKLTDNWSLVADIATGETTKSYLNMESYSGTGRARTETQGDPLARSWVHTGEAGIMYGPHSTIDMPDYSDPRNIRLAGPQNWGGSIVNLPQVNGNDNAQDGFINNPSFEEELTTFRLSLNGDIDVGPFNGAEVGVNYSDRTKSKVNYGAYLVAPGYNPALPAEQQGDIAVPEEYIVGTADLSFLGLGQMLAYDSVRLYRDGIYTELDATETEPGRLGDTYTVDEKVTTFYGMLDFEHGILRGNIGLQGVYTDQFATGYDALNADEDGSVVFTPVSGGDTYLEWLPSLNTTFQLTDRQVLRFAASKTMSRARMDEMRPNNTIGFNFDDATRQNSDPERSAWNGSSGNPQLRPLEAYQADLSYEFYFAQDGYMAASVFYKDLQNWHMTQSELTDFSQYIIPGYHDNGIDELESTQGFTNSIIEAGSGSVEGIELQASLPFYIFSDWLDGFGIFASATYLDGEIEYEGASQSIPGLSEEILQFTAYYEKNGFEIRVSGRKRDAYLTQFYGVSMALTPTTDQGSELWDAQIGYDFGAAGYSSLDGLSISLQAQNITDEPTIAAAEDDPRRVSQFQTFGANYMLGLNYRF